MTCRVMSGNGVQTYWIGVITRPNRLVICVLIVVVHVPHIPAAVKYRVVFSRTQKKLIGILVSV